MKKAVIISAFFMLAISVYSQISTGPNYPGTTANVTLAGSSGAWTSPGNIVSDNTVYSTIVLSSGQYSDYLLGRNYGFTIPAGATINGITVEVERFGSSNNRISDYDVYLTKNGTTPVGTDKSGGSWPTSPTIKVYGGVADLWGTTWTPAEINSASFGVMLSATSSNNNITASVDYIRITVTYTAPFNDDCSTAIPIAVGTSCSFATFTNVGATYSAAPAPGCASYGSSCQDVWFSVTVPACGHLIFDSDEGGITDGGMAIYSGTCGSLSLIDCDDDGSVNGMMPMIDAAGLTPGSTVYICFWEYGGGTEGTFDICVYNPDPDCSGTPSPGATSFSPSGIQCIGDNFTLSTAQATQCGITYQWQSSPDNVTYSNISGATNSTYNATATVTTWYRALVTCSYSGLSAYSTPVQVVVSNTTSTCANAQLISSVPFTATGLTTCCMGNDYVSGDACTSSYLGGEDYVFTYTPAADIIIDISLFNTLSYTGIFVTKKCPDAGGATCVAYEESSSGNPQLCGVSLQGGSTYYIVIDTYPSPDCTPFDINVAETSAPTCDLNYAISATTFTWENMSGGSNITIPTDDDFASSWTTLGFTFCFDGIGYTQALLSSNGYIIFPPIGCVTNLPTGNAIPDGTSGWSIDYPLPNTNQAPRNCIMFPWMDTDPNNGGTMTFKVFGTAPNRYAVFEYDNVHFFSSSCPNRYMTAQVKLFETTYNIEIHIDQKDTCEYWNEGAAVLGLHNYNGTIAQLVYNYPDIWSVTTPNRAWLFDCNCPDCNVSLPVELTSFTGTRVNDTNIELRWETASEINNDFFEIERLNNMGDFICIGKVQGNGNSNQLISYSFMDVNASIETSYYRLKQLDFNGDFTYSPIISVNSLSETIISVQVSPNPADEIIHVAIDSPVDNAVIILVSATGIEYVLKSDVSVKTKDAFSFDITTYPSGMYLFIIRTADNEILFSDKLFIR